MVALTHWLRILQLPACLANLLLTERTFAKKKSSTSYLGRIIFSGTACLFCGPIHFGLHSGLVCLCGVESSNKQAAQVALLLTQLRSAY